MPVDPAQLDDLRRIQLSQWHLLELINQVLNYMRVDAGAVHYDIEHVRVLDALKLAESLALPQMRVRRLEYALPECDAGLVARADREKLQQVLLNLLTNTAAISHEGWAATSPSKAWRATAARSRSHCRSASSSKRSCAFTKSSLHWRRPGRSVLQRTIRSAGTALALHASTLFTRRGLTGEFVTAEHEWMDVLQNVPAWDAPQAPVLLIAPHPDDETLGGGGLIAAMSERGFDISVAAVTDGEHAYPGDTPQQSRELRRLRIDEQTRALERLGVSPEKIVRFGLPDSAVENHFDALVDRLLPLASADTHLIAPWRDDFHPDHRACGLAAERVAVRTGARLTSYFFWTWHHGSPAEVGALTLRRFPLTPALLRAKREALACHHSQLYRESGDPILPEHLLEPARRCFETFLVAE